MSNFFRVSFCILCIVLLGCGGESNSPSSTNSRTGAATKSKSATLPNSLKPIFQTNKGIFRGIALGVGKSEVRNKESAKLLGSSSKELRYTIDVKEGIFADVVYVFRGGMLFEIKLDVFTKNRRDASKIYRDLATYFDKIYKNRKRLWDGSDGKTDFTVFSKQVGEKSGNHGVYVVWEQI